MKKWTPVLFFLSVFGLYLWTAPGAVSPYRDSGDLLSAIHCLGVAHPSGYPLYVLLGKAWLTLVPWGDAAYRVHLLSGLFGALGALGVGLLSLRFTEPQGSSWQGWTAAALYALAAGSWRLSQTSEMYTLNALFVVVILGLIWGGDDERGVKLSLAVFLFGLGLGAHQTLVFVAPALGWALWKKQAWRRPSLLVLFLLGLSVYAFLPIRSFQEPVVDWGNPETLRAFWRVMTRADYGGFRLHPDRSAFVRSIPEFWQEAKLTVQAFQSQFAIAGLLLAMMGFWIGRKQSSIKGTAFLFLLSGPIFFLVANLDPSARETLPILEPNLLLPNLCLALAVGAALTVFSGRWKAAGAGLALGLLVWNGVRGWRETQNRWDLSAYDYGKNVLSNSPQGSLIYNPDDPTTFVLSAFQVCRGWRTDVVPLVYFRTRWGYERLKRFHPELLPNREIRSGQELAQVLLDYNLMDGRTILAELPQKFPQGSVVFPQGLLYQLYREPLGKTTDLLKSSEEKFLFLRHRPGVAPGQFFTDHTREYLAAAHSNFGLEYAKGGDYSSALRHYARALNLSPRLHEAWNNRGVAYHETKRYSQAAACYELGLEIKPNDPLLQANLRLAKESMSRRSPAH